MSLPAIGVAFQGIFAVETGNASAYVVRLADGAVKKVSPGPNRTFERIVAVTATELWAIMGGRLGHEASPSRASHSVIGSHLMHHRKETAAMWKKPELTEVKMDAEIGSYQEDDAPPRDMPPSETLRRPLFAEDDGR